jgi:peptidyl-prolyl cis-trans isomerase SurA
MKKVWKLWILLALMPISQVLQAQPASEVLFTINQNPFYTDEFKRVYFKNLELVKDESQKDLDNYLQLFVGYKLKIARARQLGLHENAKYINELQTYRSQLSKNYTTDSQVTDALVQEAYERSKYEVEASHILFMLDENAAPADTLRVYNELMKLRKQAKDGTTSFADLAKKFSEDPSAKENSGYLGFFSAFRMVYPFESAAFKTPVGEISKPIRTRFGYHLIHVKSKRPNRGELTVAHIMLNHQRPSNTEASGDAKSIIDDLYKKIHQGESFELLAKQFSDDKATAAKGGVLSRFGAGQISVEAFENAAFALTAEKPISKPVETEYGWHIIKLIEQHPIGSLEELRPELERKIARDERSRLIETALVDKLRKRYNWKADQKLLSQITPSLTDAFFEGSWAEPATKPLFEKPLFTINEKQRTPNDFFLFIKTAQYEGYAPQDKKSLVSKLFDKYVDQEITAYYNDNLENEFPEFAAVMQEYRDGLLLFELMEQEIWNRSKTDTLGYTRFYEKNIGRYQWKPRYTYVLFSSQNPKALKKARDMYRKGASPDAIKQKLNVKDQVQIMVLSATHEEGQTGLPANMPRVAGLSGIFNEEGYVYFADVKEVKPAGAKTIDECRGRVINDYQQYLEANWLDELRNQFKVEVNTAVFEKVKSEVVKSLNKK